MTKRTPWAHLPNARHIDAVLEDVKARPEEWQAVHPKDILTTHWQPKWGAARKSVQRAVLYKLHGSAFRMGYAAAVGPILALISWDDSAALLECTPDVLREMIDLAEPPVCHQAALLLPYAIVRMHA